MGVVATKNIRSALVYYDSGAAISGGNRWYDAFGPNVAKYVTEFVSLPHDDSTTDPTEWTDTVVEAGAGTSTAVQNDVAGGGLIITTAASTDDGWSMQLGNPNTGEFVIMDGVWHTYFGVEFALNDATQTDVFLGLAVTDTAMLGGVTDGVYFRAVDGSAVLNFVIEKDSVESSTAVATLVDATYVTAEFYHDGNNIMAYIDGVLVATIADSDASFPNDELLRLSVEFLTGEDVANTCSLKNLRLIHIR